MNDLLTTHQVEDLLQVDRTTVYRMLNDGRLRGVKIGRMWRFPRASVEALLNGHTQTKVVGPSSNGDCPTPLCRVLPPDLIQPVQDVFAEIVGVGAVTADRQGRPCTALSNCHRFCQLIRGRESGRAACQASWRRLGLLPEKQTGFHTCHAGLRYARTCVDASDTQPAMFIVGQFNLDEPELVEVAERVARLAAEHGIDRDELLEAAAELPVLDQTTQRDLSRWLRSVGKTLERVARERSRLTARLDQIAALSDFEQE